MTATPSKSSATPSKRVDDPDIAEQRPRQSGCRAVAGDPVSQPLGPRRRRARLGNAGRGKYDGDQDAPTVTTRARQQQRDGVLAVIGQRRTEPTVERGGDRRSS